MAPSVDITTAIIRDIEARRASVNSGFARFYAPLTVLTFTMTFFPFYQNTREHGVIFGSLWHEVTRPGRSLEVMALIVLLIVVVLLALAGLERLGVAGLIATAACLVFIGSLLWASPGMSDRVSHSEAGIADIVICFGASLALIVHGACLILLRQRELRLRTRYR